MKPGGGGSCASFDPSRQRRTFIYCEPKTNAKSAKTARLKPRERACLFGRARILGLRCVKYRGERAGSSPPRPRTVFWQTHSYTVFEVEYRRPRRVVIISKIMTNHLTLQHSTSIAVMLGAPHKRVLPRGLGRQVRAPRSAPRQQCAPRPHQRVLPRGLGRQVRAPRGALRPRARRDWRCNPK